MDPGLQIHPSIFGFFKNEIPEGQRIKLFVTMGSKNYSYDCEDVVTKKVVQRVVKIRGLTLKGDMSTAIDTNQMLDFVEKIQENKRIEKSIQQFILLLYSHQIATAYTDVPIPKLVFCIARIHSIAFL